MLPRCTQMKMSVSKSIESGSPQLVHLLFRGLGFLISHLEKRVGYYLDGFFAIGRDDKPLYLSMVEKSYLFSLLKRFKDVLHFILQVDNGCFHMNLQILHTQYIHFFARLQETSKPNRLFQSVNQEKQKGKSK